MVELEGLIEKIEYRKIIQKELKRVSSCNINEWANVVCFNNFAIAKWSSPKRSKTYPYARVYDALSNESCLGKVISIIPIIKIESLTEKNYIQ